MNLLMTMWNFKGQVKRHQKERYSQGELGVGLDQIGEFRFDNDGLTSKVIRIAIHK